MVFAPSNLPVRGVGTEAPFVTPVRTKSRLFASGSVGPVAIYGTLDPSTQRMIAGALGTDQTSDLNAAKTIVISVRTDLDHPGSWVKGKDGFVASLESTIRTLQSKRSHPKVVVVAVPSAGGNLELFAEGVGPLVKQACRETGVRAFIGDGSSVTTLYDLRFAVTNLKDYVKGWTVIGADSFEKGEGDPGNAIDGDPDTYWHTQYSGSEPKPPHFIAIDLGMSQNLAGLRYLPRQDGGTNGRIKQYAIYVSDDPNNWGEPVAQGSFKDTSAAEYCLFNATATGRFVKFVELSEANGGPWASAAEITPILR